ncbi:MAG: 50S ribosome-binding GTPase [archaeon]|nr:50S ribosome-binding GTPase [archaeon]MCR4323601.1 50S ribosome-binding GTPase [Nanoarchaeota archaeon]
MGFWPVVLNVLRNSDVVLLLVDARMPELTRNSEIIKKVEAMKGKRLVLVFNKCDLASKKDLDKLREDYHGAFFISCTKKKNVKELGDYLRNLADNWNSLSLRVGLVGYPNVGKSALINILAPMAKAKVSPVSGTTKKTQWARNGNIRIMDSPGVIPFGDRKVQVGMSSAKDPHRIRNPEKVALRVVEFLDERNDGTLGRFYGVDKKLKGYDLFLAIGKKMGYLVKGGEIDEHRTAIKILIDWQQGKISLRG